MIDSRRPPTFVVGPPRTGTTLLARILRTHRETNPDAKRAILSRLETVYGRFDQPVEQQTVEQLLARRSNRDRLRAADTYRDIFDQWMSIQAEAEGKTRWGNHFPRDLFHLAEVRELFPEAKVIACVRDIRGFLASYKHQWKTCAYGAARKRNLYHPLVTSLLWRACIERVRAAPRLFGADRVLIVRYEELVATPEATVRRVCNFLDLPFDPSLLDLDGSNSSFADERDGIFTSSVERWRQEISREETYIAEKVAGRLLGGLDYVAEHPRPNMVHVATTLASFPTATLRALHASRTTRGPLLPYLRERVAALYSAQR